MPRKHKGGDHEEAHENHEAWVIPYADMLTLLMGLFLVMWSIGETNLAKLEAVQSGFAGALGIGVSSGSDGALDGGSGVLDGTFVPEPMVVERMLPPERVGEAVEALEAADAAEIAREIEGDRLSEVEQIIAEHANAVGVGESVSFRREDRGLVVSIVSDQVLFDGGSAVLRAEGRDVLTGLAPVLARLPNQIAIEGHTDSRPISTARFPSNWELSTARATSVLRFFVDTYGLSPDRLTASGYAEQRPVADNATADGRARNRRVDIAVLSSLELDTDITPAGGDRP
ncbi:MAG TPA: OmpA family protein [Acidimicrobiales bacterium]|nr:OmpA family protein [Acidimicrobiales bacterium]